VPYVLVALPVREAEKKSGRTKMQTAATRNCFLTGCSSKVKFADSEIVVTRSSLLRHIVTSHLASTVHSQEIFVNLTDQLIRFAEQALVMRDVGALDEVSDVLMSLPVDAAREIGRYYYSLAMYRKGQRDEADALLEKIADEGPITYRPQAIQALGTHRHANGQLDEALRLQLEALRAAGDRNAQGLQTTLLANWEVLIIKSDHGDHKGALSDLKSLAPLVHQFTKQKPFYFYAYCNALAIELGEVGHVEEAEAASRTALKCPIASAYPEWAETRQELEAKRTSATPSVVAVSQTSEVTPALQTQPQPCPVQPKPCLIRKRIVAFCWLSSRGTFHKAALTIVSSIPIANHLANCNTLDQLGRCIKSRAPPA
jgi:tetratricopeptide (TPR) repeat protein